MKLNPQYIVDDLGKRKGVLLGVEEYQRLLEILEDQLDATDLDQAAAQESQFAPYEQVRADLTAKGLL